MKKRKKKKKNSKQFNRQFKKTFFTKKSAIIIVCTVIILSAFWGAYQKVERKAAKYQKTIDELKTEVKNLNQTNKTLEKEKNNIDTDESKERIARERLGMIKEGEISLQEAQIRQHNLRQRIKQQHKKQIKNFKKPLTYHKIHGMILPVECGGIAQLARARGSYPRCRWFKSSSRYFEKGLYKPFFYFFKEQTDTGKLIIAKVTVVAARRVSGESSSVK